MRLRPRPHAGAGRRFDVAAGRLHGLVVVGADAGGEPADRRDSVRGRSTRRAFRDRTGSVHVAGFRRHGAVRARSRRRRAARRVPPAAAGGSRGCDRRRARPARDGPEQRRVGVRVERWAPLRGHPGAGQIPRHRLRRATDSRAAEGRTRVQSRSRGQVDARTAGIVGAGGSSRAPVAHLAAAVPDRARSARRAPQPLVAA